MILQNAPYASFMSDVVPQVYSTFIYTDIVSRMESGIGMDALMLILLSTLFTVVFSDECTVKNVSFILSTLIYYFTRVLRWQQNRVPFCIMDLQVVAAAIFVSPLSSWNGSEPRATRVGCGSVPPCFPLSTSRRLQSEAWRSSRT